MTSVLQLKVMFELFSGEPVLGFTFGLAECLTDDSFCSSAADYHSVSEQVKQLEKDTVVVLEEVTKAKSTMGRVLSAWDSYSDCLSSLQAWMEQVSVTHSQSHRPEVLLSHYYKISHIRLVGGETHVLNKEISSAFFVGFL